MNLVDYFTKNDRGTGCKYRYFKLRINSDREMFKMFCSFGPCRFKHTLYITNSFIVLISTDHCWFPENIS